MMPVTGQEIIAENIIAYGGQFLATVDKTMDKVRQIMDEKITINISLTDHSLKDLARMDHPYARRHGPLGKPIHNPYYQVHEQSGEMRRSKKSGIVKASMTGGQLNAIAYAGLDEAVAPHALNVVFGTSKMIPRPVLEGSRQFVIQDAKAIIQRDLKNMTFNFKGKS